MIEPSRLRILLVEDNELDARTMRRALERDEGPTTFEVDHVGDLKSAIDELDTVGYDCVLLDLSLPDSEGLIALDRITQHTPHAPVVVLTGLNDPSTAVDAVTRGAQDYLGKGEITPDLVARSIRYAVARHHSETELRTTTDLLRVLQDRERIARDLHDTVVQQLFAIGMSLQATSVRVDDAAIKELMLSNVDDIDAAIRQLRQAIFDLHVASADETIASEVARIAAIERDALGFDATVRIGDVGRVSEATRPELLAVIREALSNVAKHARASAAEVMVDTEGSELVVRVSDNGRGLDDDTIGTREGGTGHGLRNLARRAEKLSGSFRVGPGPGGGTELEWRAPIA